MARKVSPGSDTRPLASNPAIFGEDVENLALVALGLTATATVNDTLVSPIVSKVVPGQRGGTVGKLVDAASTALAAWLLGEGFGMVNGHWGTQMKRGGLVLAMGKVLTAFIPGVELSGKLTLPAGIPIFGKQAVAAPAAASNGAAALPSGSASLATRFAPNPNYGTLTPQLSAGL